MVRQAAEKLLQRNRFDHERLPSDDETDEEFSDLNRSDTGDSDDSDDSDEEEKRKEKKRKQKKKLLKTKKKSRILDDSEDEEATQKTYQDKKKKSTKTKAKTKEQVTDSNVEDLINKLNKMSVNDQDYAGLYLRACKLNPMVKDVLESLSRQKQAPPRQRADQPRRDNNGAPPFGRPSARSDTRCYGCGEQGHMTARCPAIADYISKGIVTKDPASGRVTLKNGNPIMRLRDETLKAAIVRATQTQSNFITVNHASVNYYESSCSDNEEEYTSYTETDTPIAYNIERPSRKITETRKDKGEGILGTARKEINRKRTRARDEQEEDPKPKTRGSLTSSSQSTAPPASACERR